MSLKRPEKETFRKTLFLNELFVEQTNFGNAMAMAHTGFLPQGKVAITTTSVKKNATMKETSALSKKRRSQSIAQQAYTSRLEMPNISSKKRYHNRRASVGEYFSAAHNEGQSTLLYDIAPTPRQVALLARQEQSRVMKEEQRKAEIVSKVLKEQTGHATPSPLIRKSDLEPYKKYGSLTPAINKIGKAGQLKSTLRQSKPSLRESLNREFKRDPRKSASSIRNKDEDASDSKQKIAKKEINKQEMLKDDISVQNLPNAELSIAEEGINDKSSKSRATPFGLYQNASIASIQSNLTQSIDPKDLIRGRQSKHSQSQVRKMQKSISQALQQWNYDESLVLDQKSRDSKSSVYKKQTNQMKNVFQLAKFAKSPSSAQVIYEEKNITAKDLLQGDASMRDELQAMLADRRRKRQRSQLREQQEQILKLSKSGQQTQMQVTNLGRTLGAKITTDQYLDKSVLKKLIAKKCESMFPGKVHKKVKLVYEDTDTQRVEVEVMEQTLDRTSKFAAAIAGDHHKTMENRDSSMSFIKQDDSPKPLNKHSYSYMMQELKKKIAEQPFVRKDEHFEKRKARFFSNERDKAESRIIHEAMQKIGFYQIEENNLDYIKGVAKNLDKSVKAKAQVAEKRRQTLMVPPKLKQLSTLPV